MRNIKYIVVHCTATPQTTTVESIKNHWKNFLGWKTVGYHFLIKPDGEIVHLAEINEITNGVKGYNKESVHVSYIGGGIKDDRTKEQKESLLTVIHALRKTYPNAKILGHRDFPNIKKACPNFNAIEEYKNI